MTYKKDTWYRYDNGNWILVETNYEQIEAQISDLQDKYSDISISVGQIETTVGEIDKDVNSLNKTVAKQQTQINQTAKAVTLKADKEYVDKETGEVLEYAKSQFEVTANAITSEVTARKRGDTALNSRITQTAAEIKSEVSAISDTVEGQTQEISEIKQAATEISSSVKVIQEDLVVQQSEIKQTSDKVSIVVDSSGNINSASIVAAINEDGGSSVKINADTINLEGAVTLDSLNSEAKSTLLKDTLVEYAYGEDTINHPTSGWTTSELPRIDNYYVWQRITIVYLDDDYPDHPHREIKYMCSQGNDGKDGQGIQIEADRASCTEPGDCYIGDDGHLYVLEYIDPETHEKVFRDCGRLEGEKGSPAFRLDVFNPTDFVPCDANKNPTYTPEQWVEQTEHEVRVVAGETLITGFIVSNTIPTSGTAYTVVYDATDCTYVLDRPTSVGAPTDYLKGHLTGIDAGKDEGTVKYSLYIGTTFLASDQFKASKSVAGQTGADGQDGADGVDGCDYFIVTNTSLIKKVADRSSDVVISPSGPLEISFYKRIGTDPAELFEGCYYRYYIDNSVNPTQGQSQDGTLSIAHNILESISSILKIELWLDSAYTNFGGNQTFTIIRDGADGVGTATEGIPYYYKHNDPEQMPPLPDFSSTHNGWTESIPVITVSDISSGYKYIWKSFLIRQVNGSDITFTTPSWDNGLSVAIAGRAQIIEEVGLLKSTVTIDNRTYIFSAWPIYIQEVTTGDLCYCMDPNPAREGWYRATVDHGNVSWDPADLQITTYHQANQPSSANINDLWYNNTSWYRYITTDNGSDAEWVKVENVDYLTQEYRMSSIEQTADGIDARVTNAEGDISDLNMWAGGLTLTASEPTTYEPWYENISNYGFELNTSDGWYYATNAGANKDFTYALTRCHFYVSEENTQKQIYISVKQHGVINHNFGILSQIDTELSNSLTEDAAPYPASYKWNSSVDIDTMATLTADSNGWHFVDIKYYKLSDQSDDYFKFDVSVPGLPTYKKSTISLTSGSTEITSTNIKFQGLVTFENLVGTGQTVINGANIETGTLSANKITTGTLSADRVRGGRLQGSAIYLTDAETPDEDSCQFFTRSDGYTTIYNGDTLQAKHLIATEDLSAATLKVDDVLETSKLKVTNSLEFDHYALGTDTTTPTGIVNFWIHFTTGTSGNVVSIRATLRSSSSPTSSLVELSEPYSFRKKIRFNHVDGDVVDWCFEYVDFNFDSYVYATTSTIDFGSPGYTAANINPVQDSYTYKTVQPALFPIAATTAILGTPSNRWDTVYANTLDVAGATITTTAVSSRSITITESLTTSGLNHYLVLTTNQTPNYPISLDVTYYENDWGTWKVRTIPCTIPANTSSSITIDLNTWNSVSFSSSTSLSSITTTVEESALKRINTPGISIANGTNTITFDVNGISELDSDGQVVHNVSWTRFWSKM